MTLKLTRAQAAQSLQVTTKTLAAWEKAGKIPAAQRDVRGWRVYDEAAIGAIRRALALTSRRLRRPRRRRSTIWRLAPATGCRGLSRRSPATASCARS